MKNLEKQYFGESFTEISEMAEEYGSVFKASTFEESSWESAKAARFYSVISIFESSGMV